MCLAIRHRQRAQYHILCISLQWRHNGRDGISNFQCPSCLFRHRSKKTSKLHVTGLCEGNPPVTGGFPSQRASNVENVSIWWRYHVLRAYTRSVKPISSKWQHFCCSAGWNLRTMLTWSGPWLNIDKDNLSGYTEFLLERFHHMKVYVDGLVQERRNSSALAMELRLSCTKPSMCRKGLVPVTSPKYMYICSGIVHKWLHITHCDFHM